MSKFIVLGVTGGIATYKAADLVSKLVTKGYEVQVVMSENAVKFVSPLTFQTLSRNRVIVSLWDEYDWRPSHVSLAERADLFAVVPATANFIGKMACGIADDAISTFGMTMKCPVLLAPAMNPAMFANPAVTENIAKLVSRGVNIVGPESGRVACGEDGYGRMSEVAQILDAIEKLLK